jgi:Asp-tRNA(Asn)/Glu-tRNA(Gln) amidotransferase A subunit family amidase
VAAGSTDLWSWSATDLLRALDRREVSAVEAVDVVLARARAAEPRINALVTLVDERARAEAAASDRRRAAGEGARPLEGLPISVKDTLATAGVRSTAGTVKLRDHVPAEDAVAVAKLRAAGAIVVAKSNVPELGGDIDCTNPVFGPTANPWDLGRVPGGSSGGEAAALAARLTFLGVGSDSGGSLRIPAHCTGVMGFKPTWGTVSRVGHLPPETGTAPNYQAICAVGPMARSVEDLALAHNAMRGPSWDSPNTVPTPDVAPMGVRVDGRRAWWFTHADGVPPVAARVRAGVERAVAALADAGMAVEERTPPVLDEALRVNEGFYDADGGRMMLEWYGASLVDARPELVERLTTWPARATSAADFFRAAIYRDDVRARFAKAMDDDGMRVIVTAPFCTTAFPHDAATIDIDGTRHHRLEAIWPTTWPSFLGLPAVVVPCGLADDGLPTGVQVVGRAFDDETVLAVAAVLERELGGCPVPPLAR